MFLTRVKSSDDSTSKQILLPRLDENESRSYSIAAASMKNAYSPSSFLTFQMHCFIRMFSSYSPDWAMGMFLDAIASPCSYLCQSVSAVGQWVSVTSQNVVVFIKIIPCPSLHCYSWSSHLASLTPWKHSTWRTSEWSSSAEDNMVFKMWIIISRMGWQSTQWKIKILTPKKAFVDPQQNVPYLILVCLARSSAEFTGDDILDAVKKAERGENVT